LKPSCLFFDFVIGDERPVDALDPAAAGHEEHVAHAEQLFRALLAQNGALNRSSR
jgi:hypothetical protein